VLAQTDLFVIFVVIYKRRGAVQSAQSEWRGRLGANARMGLLPAIVRDLIIALAVFASVGAQAAPCGNYPAVAARAIKPRVEALRLVEREAADRRVGLDTRPWPYLVGQARAVAAAVGETRALQDEDGLDRCPNPVPHVRRGCASAALALAGAIEEEAAGAASQMSKQIYGQAMAICEGFMGLTPLDTALRASD
jgi:hypothetical protein